MSEQASSEMLMYLKTSGQMLDAESTSTIDGKDALMQGFSAGKFFEVESFSFSMELDDDEGRVSDNDQSEKRSYARWRGLGEKTTKPTPPFRAEPGDMSVSRRIDSSSPILLKHCLDASRFDEAVLVRRARDPVTGMLAGTMRMTFGKVWLKTIDWEDGDTVRETCKFRFSSVAIVYVRQKADGSPGPSANCKWTSVVAV